VGLKFIYLLVNILIPTFICVNWTFDGEQLPDPRCRLGTEG